MNAEILRLILFIAGLTAVALVFFWERYKRRKAAARLRTLRDLSDGHDKREPIFGTSYQSGEDSHKKDPDGPEARDFRLPPGAPPDGVRVIRRSPESPTPPLPEPETDSQESDRSSESTPPKKPPAASVRARPVKTGAPSALARWVGWLWPFHRRGSTSADSSPTSTRRRPAPQGGSDDSTEWGPARLIVQINVSARQDPFTGHDIVQIADELGLEVGDMNILHRYEDIDGQPSIIFSLASMVEPGYFPLNRMGSYSTPGLTLFTQLPGPKDGLAIFSDMLFTAQRIAEVLDGELQDETHSRLTRQVIEHIRGLIQEHRRKTQILRRP